MYTIYKSTEEIEKRLTSYATLNLWQEKESNFEFELDVPGFSNDEVRVSTKGHFISIATVPKEGNSRKAFSIEHKLPSSALASNTSACLENGVLTVIVPKKEQEKTNLVPIKNKI